MTASMHAFSSAFSQSDFFGKLIFLGLFILSFVCWMILIYKTWVLSEVNKSSNKFLMYIEKHKGNLLKLQTDNLVHNKFKEIPQPFSKIFSIIKSKTLELLEKNHFFIHESQNASSVYLSRADIDLIENHLLATIMTQKELLEKKLTKIQKNKKSL